MSSDLPPLSKPVIIRQFNGQALLCIVEKIDSTSLKLIKVHLLEVIGSRGASYPIYDVKKKLGSLSLPIDSVVHWEIAPEDLGVSWLSWGTWHIRPLERHSERGKWLGSRLLSGTPVYSGEAQKIEDSIRLEVGDRYVAK